MLDCFLAAVIANIVGILGFVSNLKTNGSAITKRWPTGILGFASGAKSKPTS
jgi:hypothetical protein